MIAGRGRALSGALALMAASGAWMVAGPRPAEAYVCAFNIKSPTENSISGSSTVHFRGAFEVKHGLAERVVEVTFSAAPGPMPPPTVSRRSAAEPPGDYDVPVVLSRNGTYTATVRAIHTGTSPIFNCDDGLGPERRATEASAVVQFKVSVPASPPRNVTARFDPGSRTAIVTWERSGDPDIAGYTIIKKVGAEPATGVPVGAEPLSWTDTNLPSGGATITYSVQASRQGPDAGTTSVPSDPVAAAPLVVPAGPAPAASTSTTTGGTGGPAPPGGGATSTTVPFTLGPAVGGDTGPQRKLPFLGFGGPTLPESGSAADPDGQGGYQPLIPYSPGGGEGTWPVDDGDQAIAGRGSGGRGPGEGTPGLAYVASGLLSSVVAAHILWLRRQALRPEPAGAGSQHELETVPSPDPEPSPAAPPVPADEASPFEPVRDEAPADAPEDPEPVVRRRPLRAVREPAVAAAAAGAGAILRPARDRSETFEPVTPLPRSKRSAPRARPIVVAVPAAERGQDPAPPVPSAGAEPAAIVPDADPQPSAQPAWTGAEATGAGDSREPEGARASLRARLVRSRHRPTPWIVAEPVEQAAPTKPEPEPEVEVEAEGAEPEGAEPEGAEPEGAEPEGEEPEGAEPERAEPATSGRPMLILRSKGTKTS